MAEKIEYPLLSVVAICFNHSKFVTQTLDSILAQQFENIQLVIIDDNSTDDSVAIIKKWINDNRVDCVFIEHSENMGLCYSLNEAIKKCRGKYVKIIACDDVLIKGSLTKQVAILENSSQDVALVCGNVIEIDELDNELGEYFPKNYQFPQNVLKAIFEGHQGKPIVIHSPSVLIRRRVYNEIGPYPEDIIQEDFYMWVKVSLKYEIIFNNDVYVKYRVLTDSLSNDLKYRSKILLDRLRVCEEISGEIHEHDTLQTIYNEKVKIIRHLIVIYLNVKNMAAGEKYFNEFAQLVKNDNEGQTKIEKLLKTISKINVNFAYYLYKKYDITIKNWFLKMYVFLRIPFY